MGLVSYKIFNEKFSLLSCYGAQKITANDMVSLYKFSASHDLAHIVGSALTDLNLFDRGEKTSENGENSDGEKTSENDENNGDGLRDKAIFAEAKKRFDNAVFTAVYRYEILNSELDGVCEALENCGVDFIPLKGSVLKFMYPSAWLRTSCDVDVLVKPEDVESAVNGLIAALSYKQTGVTSHDIGLETPSGMHVELHYDLIEDAFSESAAKVLKNGFDLVKKSEKHKKEFTPEAFYFYHVAHMVKHFVFGGCGIRPFIDLEILNKYYEKEDDGTTRQKIDELLKRGGLKKFEIAARKLACAWFFGGERDEVVNEMENYILRAGIYGNMENRVLALQQKKGGKFKYFMSRVFAPYSTLVLIFPILKKHKWLMPFCQIGRWFKILFSGRGKRAVKELSLNGGVNKAESKKMNAVLKDLGLN